MKRCSQCNSEMPEEAKFCSECGQAVGATVCRTCKSPLKAGAKFCSKCGTAVEAGASGVGVIQDSVESEIDDLPAPTAKARPSWQAALIASMVVLATASIFFLLIYNKEKPQPAGVMGQTPSEASTGDAAGSSAAMEDVRQRIDQFKSALQTNPKDTTALFGLGQMYEMASMFSEASDYYRRYLEVAPNNADVRMALAGTFFNQQEIAKAEAELKETIRRRPNYDMAMYNLGVIYAAGQKKAEAIKAWHKVMELSPGSELAQKAANNIKAVSQ